MAIKKISVGLIGFGTVGSGVVKILRERRALLAEKIGMEIVLKRVCDRDLVSRRSVSVDRSLLTKDPAEVLNDSQIDIVVELIGGTGAAKEIIVAALNKGKHVVTANKALLAEQGKELFALARERGKNIYFEASVGAGIPLIKALREGLVANRFRRFFGIVNGTSNYILSQMSHEGCSFAAALKQAQQKGFAEANPILDIEGFDSQHKLVLLAFLGFGVWAQRQNVYVEGISRVSSADVEYARELGYEIKLLAIAQREGRALELRVHPTMVPRGHMLASVAGVYNALYVESDLAGELLFYGPGAGQLCAASAVVSDLVDLAQDLKAGMFRSTLKTAVDPAVEALRRIDDSESRYYVRFMASDKPGVLAHVAGILARYRISIASVTQKQRSRQEVVPIVMITHEAREKDMRSALERIGRLGTIKEKPIAIRIETF